MKILHIPSTDLDPSPIIEFLEEELEGCDYSMEALYQVDIAIEEVLVNIVSYAGLEEDETIEVHLDILDSPLRVMMRFLDTGTPFDPLAAEDPDLSVDALEEREGGLGIYMVKQMMDSVSYAYENGKNVLTFLKTIE